MRLACLLAADLGPSSPQITPAPLGSQLNLFAGHIAPLPALTMTDNQIAGCMQSCVAIFPMYVADAHAFIDQQDGLLTESMSEMHLGLGKCKRTYQHSFGIPYAMIFNLHEPALHCQAANFLKGGLTHPVSMHTALTWS